MIERFRDWVDIDLCNWWYNNKGNIFAIFALIAISAVAAIIADLVTKPGFTAQELCIEAGYPDIKKAGGAYWCVGIRDGNTVTISVSELETGE